jgi:hypothetical protein
MKKKILTTAISTILGVAVISACSIRTEQPGTDQPAPGVNRHQQQSETIREGAIRVDDGAAEASALEEAAGNAATLASEDVQAARRDIRDGQLAYREDRDALLKEIARLRAEGESEAADMEENLFPESCPGTDIDAVLDALVTPRKSILTRTVAGVILRPDINSSAAWRSQWRRLKLQFLKAPFPKSVIKPLPLPCRTRTATNTVSRITRAVWWSCISIPKP